MPIQMIFFYTQMVSPNLTKLHLKGCTLKCLAWLFESQSLDIAAGCVLRLATLK